MTPIEGGIPTIYEGTYSPPIGATYEEIIQRVQQDNYTGDLQVVKSLPTLQDLLTQSTSDHPSLLDLIMSFESTVTTKKLMNGPHDFFSVEITCVKKDPETNTSTQFALLCPVFFHFLGSRADLNKLVSFLIQRGYPISHVSTPLFNQKGVRPRLCDNGHLHDQFYCLP